MQLNPRSNCLYVHINYSALHLACPIPPPKPLPFVLRLPWQPRVAVLMSETPPRTLVQALGQVMCAAAAGHRLTPKNKMAVVPPSHILPHGRAPSSSLTQKRGSAPVLARYLFALMTCAIRTMRDALGVIGVTETHHRAELSEPPRDQLPV